MGSLPILDIKSFNEYIPENDQCIMFENENNVCINNLFAMGTFDDIILNINKYLKYNKIHYIDVDSLSEDVNLNINNNDIIVFNKDDTVSNIPKIYKNLKPLERLSENMLLFKKDLSSVLVIDDKFKNESIYVDNNSSLIKINLKKNNIQCKDDVCVVNPSKLTKKESKKSRKHKHSKNDTKIVVIPQTPKNSPKTDDEKKSEPVTRVVNIEPQTDSSNKSENPKPVQHSEPVSPIRKNIIRITKSKRNNKNNLNAKLLTNYKNVKNNKMASYILDKNIDDEGNCEVLFTSDSVDIDLNELRDCNLINLKFKSSATPTDTANATIDMKSLLSSGSTSKILSVSAREMEEISPLDDKEMTNGNTMMYFGIFIIIVLIIGAIYYFYFMKNKKPGLPNKSALELS